MPELTEIRLNILCEGFFDDLAGFIVNVTNHRLSLAIERIQVNETDNEPDISVGQARMRVDLKFLLHVEDELYDVP
jgi:hypothetical protein